MSNKAISLARKVRGISSGAMHQLMLLADHANDKFQCWPSQHTLADDQGVSIDTVQRRNAELEDAGFLKQRRRGNKHGGRTSNFYTLILNAKSGVKPHRYGLTGGVKPQSCGLYKEPPSYESSNLPRRGVVRVSLEPWNELCAFLQGDYAKEGDRQTIAGIIYLTGEGNPDSRMFDGLGFSADEVMSFVRCGWLRRETYQGIPAPDGKWLRITDAGRRALERYAEAQAA